MRDAILFFALGATLALALFLGLHQPPPPPVPCPTAILRPYHVVYQDQMTKKVNDIRIRASRIDRKDGCVIFYRENDVIDTILCVSAMDQLVVTEEN